ncbi:MAG: hypothetical protein ACHQ1E_02920 [Ktedonobacterales bacterium]
MAQDTYKIPQVQWWGLPVGIVFICSAVAATFYVNQGNDTFTNGLIGAIALPVLALGITGLGAFIYSVIARGVARGEAPRYVPESAQ